MTPLSQFSQYLLKLDPQRNQARLTLFNYLKHVVDPELAFSPAVLQEFYARALQFSQWQSDSQSLSDTIKADVQSFLKYHGLNFENSEWAELRHPDTLQMVRLSVFRDFEEIVLSTHQSGRSSRLKIKTIRLSDQQIMALLLLPEGGLEVKVFSNTALIWGPRLRLTAPVTRLRYSPELELTRSDKQILEGTLLTTHVFHVDDDGVHGLITRGHTFQKFETFIRAKLTDTQDLFESLKKLERHFINPQSDPYYQEIISRLERANRLLSNPTPENLDTAERALNKGRSCLKSAFPNDRLLALLVTHLDYGINQRRGLAASAEREQEREWERERDRGGGRKGHPPQ